MNYYPGDVITTPQGQREVVAQAILDGRHRETLVVVFEDLRTMLRLFCRPSRIRLPLKLWCPTSNLEVEQGSRWVRRPCGAKFRVVCRIMDSLDGSGHLLIKRDSDGRYVVVSEPAWQASYSPLEEDG